MLESIETLIARQERLLIAHDDMARLSQEDNAAFAMVRRSGFGASDSSILLGVNPWKTTTDLIKEKRTVGITDEEIAIGNKATVRKGADCEPIVLDKFTKQFNVKVHKPTPMYRVRECLPLTINFDGVIDLGGVLIPIEAKVVSPYGEKYWDKTKAIDNLASGNCYNVFSRDIKEHCEVAAKMYGIPVYYFTQIQQQMLGLGADFGYMAVIFDKEWEFKAFKVCKDEYVWEQLFEKAPQVWSMVKGEQ